MSEEFVNTVYIFFPYPFNLAPERFNTSEKLERGLERIRASRIRENPTFRDLDLSKKAIKEEFKRVKPDPLITFGKLQDNSKFGWVLKTNVENDDFDNKFYGAIYDNEHGLSISVAHDFDFLYYDILKDDKAKEILSHLPNKPGDVRQMLHESGGDPVELEENYWISEIDYPIETPRAVQPPARGRSASSEPAASANSDYNSNTWNSIAYERFRRRVPERPLDPRRGRRHWIRTLAAAANRRRNRATLTRNQMRQLRVRPQERARITRRRSSILNRGANNGRAGDRGGYGPQAARRQSGSRSRSRSRGRHTRRRSRGSSRNRYGVL